MPHIIGDFAHTWPFYLGFALAYLVGSVPFGLIITRLFGLGDVRKIGSGSIGATNVLRTGSKKAAAATLLLDGAKGFVPVLLAANYGPDMAVLAAGGAVIGHLFPVWLLFRGGKGVATTLGVLLALAWPVGLIACGLWLAAALLLRYSSLASLIAIASSPGFAYWLARPQFGEIAAFLALLVVLKHAGNIRRLVKGEESRITFRDG
ncbi:MAG: glycerol-3-phosphate 1-O-acyltransferase PlsY [Alphaproteobacteria bacterium]